MSRRFTRARRPEQKEQRRVHLLQTARALLEEGMGLTALSLNELARRAGMAKANIYRYFESREAVLLALLWHEWVRWFERFSAQTPPRARGQSLDRLIGGVADSLAEEKLLCALTAALPTVIEQNLSEAAIREFKSAALQLFDEAGHFLAARCSTLTPSLYARLLYDGAVAIIGWYPSTHPAESAARVHDSPEFRFFRRSFGPEFKRTLCALAADYVKRRRVVAVDGPPR